MAVRSNVRGWKAPFLAGAAILLAACSGTTYGTGRDPNLQTLEDLAGIAALGTKKETIEYANRAPVVEPPATGALPAPGSTPKIAATDWPDDPDERRARITSEIAAQEAEVGPGGRARFNPNFRLPRGTTTPNQVSNVSASEAARVTPEEAEAARKAFAAARANGTFDADGNPVRRYLTDPPNEYRLPDPEAPVEIAPECDEDGKFRWPWQRKPAGC